MKAKKSYLKPVLELAGLLVLGAGLAFILHNMIATPESQGGQALSYPEPENEGGTILSYPEPGALPLATPTITASKPPPCQFGEFYTTSVPSNLEAIQYSFSDPTVVMESDDRIDIAGWLPDGKRLLLVRDYQDGSQEIITFDVNTGGEHIFAKRKMFSNANPFWLDDLQAIAYADPLETQPGLVDMFMNDLRISYGNPAATERIVADIYSRSLSSNGKQVLYFSRVTGGQPQIWSGGTRSVQVIPLDLAYWTYPKYAGEFVPPAGRAFWTAMQPGGAAIAYYGSWLFIGNLLDNQLCEVELESKKGRGLSINQARWSSDGHYLAMVVTEYYGRFISVGDFISSTIYVLDLSNGHILQPDVEIKYTYDIAWSPDSKTLAFLGEKEHLKFYISADLYIGNINVGKFRKITERQPFVPGADMNSQLAWSYDNRRIVVECPTWDDNNPMIIKNRLCVIEVGQ